MFALQLLFTFLLFIGSATSFSQVTSRALSHRKLSSLGASKSSWTSSIATDPNLNVALDDVLGSLKEQYENPEIALFFISSIYENSGYTYDIIFNALKAKFPSVKTILGCTTTCPIGPGDSTLKPVEMEARTSLSMSMISLDDDIGISPFIIDHDGIQEYTKEGDTTSMMNNEEDGIALILATENSKKFLPAFLDNMKTKEHIDESIGIMASTVTSLQLPKVFLSDNSGTFEKVTKGLVGLKMTGNIAVDTVVAHSCKPIGPMFEVTEANGKEILQIRRCGPDVDAADEPQPPMVHLDHVLTEIPLDEAYLLKRELMVGLVSESADSLLAKGCSSLLKSPSFFVQEPLELDSNTGSMTVSCVPTGEDQNTGAIGCSFQFCIQDTPTARSDLTAAMTSLKTAVQNSQQQGAQEVSPLAVLLLGSIDRGNSVFRYNSWESNQVYQTLKEEGLEQQVPVTGMFGGGSFLNSPMAVMKTDSVFALLRKKTRHSATGEAVPTSSSVNSTRSLDTSTDEMTATEKDMFDDSTGPLSGVIITKRDPESAPPVRVASMDYFVPEKMPNPSNFLESLVWSRERDINKMRDLMPLPKAMLMAKLGGKKYPARSIFSAVKDCKTKLDLLAGGGAGGIPPVMVEIIRASVNNGKINQYVGTALSEECAQFMKDSAKDCESIPSVVAVGCHADQQAFGGCYEDVEILKTTTAALPVFSDDFVIYGYQIFKAKAAGADVIKLMGAVLSTKEILYFVKIAKALGIVSVVVVTSKQQLLDVLAEVPIVQAISVSSRNMRIWKVDSGKADHILQDEEVKAAIACKRSVRVLDVEERGDEEGFLLMQEGFVSSEQVMGAAYNGVDAVFLSEELLAGEMECKPTSRTGIKGAVERWIGS